MDLTRFIKLHETYYSPVCGDVVCVECSITPDDDIYYVCESNSACCWYFDKEGRLESTGEVMLFPSKTQRDWNKYVKDGDLVVTVGFDGVAQYFVFKDHVCETSGRANSYIGIDADTKDKILNWENVFWDRVATEEEKETFNELLKSVHNTAWDWENKKLININKFNKGDKICLNSKCSIPTTIKDVVDGYYELSNGISLSISEQDRYELYVEPKFKVGDRITNHISHETITNIFGNTYITEYGSIQISQQDDWIYDYVYDLDIPENVEYVKIHYNKDTHSITEYDGVLAFIKKHNIKIK